MSRLWNKPRLRIYIGEDHLAVCQLAGRWRPRVIHKETICFPAGNIAGAMATLEAWLIGHSLSVNIECVLGASHVRYLLLPWDTGLVDVGFRQTLANALFVRSFQDPPEGYEVRFASLRYGKPQLAAFVDKDLRTAFELLAQKTACRVVSLEPLLVTVWNRFQPRLAKEKGVLLIADAGRLLVLHHDHGAINDVQLRPCAVKELVDQVRRMSGVAPVRVFAPLHDELAMSLPESLLRLESESGFSARSDGAYDYALCGVF